MKTLRNHTLYFDDECPMCALYSKAMVTSGMLDDEGREAYSQAACAFHPAIDAQRARNEIALYDRANHRVTYGIDSLFVIIGNSAPMLKPLFRWSPFRWLMIRLYAFISYNRKVIAPPRNFQRAGSCTPDLHLGYRWAYIVGTWVITSLVLTTYANHLTPLVPETNFIREFMICGGQIGFQAALIALIQKEQLIHYLGNMMTVSLIGALLLLPGLIIDAWWNLGSETYAIYFLLVVLFMLFEHMRRMSRLGLGWKPTAGWLVYRLLVLLMVLR